jgi:spermidine/putrescine transport system permease protein
MMSDRLINIAFKGYILLMFLFIFTPIVILVIFSFNVERFAVLPWKGFGTVWYKAAFSDPTVVAGFWNSLVVGISVALISTFLGFTAAYFVNRWDFRGKTVYLAIAVLPPCIPLIVLGLSLLIFLTQIKLSGYLYSVVISHVVLCSAFAMAVCRMRLTEMDESLEEAAWNLGASQWRAIREVVLPQVMPAIVASLLLTMAISFDEFIIAWFVSGLDATLPVKIYSLLGGQVSPRINAIGAVAFATSITLVVLAQIAALVWGSRRSQSYKESGTTK